MASEVRSMEQRRQPDQVDVVLQPIAAPSILGLFALAGTTFIVAAQMAGWYGIQGTEMYLMPFVVFFGGLAQFLAGMWAYKARDGLATAVHGMWGSFWMAYGLLWLLFATGTLPIPVGAFPALGFWFIALSWITLMTTIAALAVNGTLVGTLLFLTAGAAFAAAGQISGTPVVTQIGGWLFVFSSFFAWYTASALLLKSTFGRWILPVGVAGRARQAPDVAVGIGEPGVTHGQ